VKQDRLLLGILVATGLLAVLALALFFLRQARQDYAPEAASETSPEVIVRNYIVALQMRDYERAYSYLADFEGKPSPDQFQQDFALPGLNTPAVAVQIGKARQSEEQAIVEITLLDAGGGPWSGVDRQPGQALLVREASGGWKITRLPYPFWGWSWSPPATPAP
jgi:hypothetical protein